MFLPQTTVAFLLPAADTVITRLQRVPLALACFFALFASQPVVAQPPDLPEEVAENTTGQSDIINRIPEPMVFDLVRPLNSRKGELEVNTLFQRRLSGKHQRLDWAPEIEWAYANGRAVELELPIENTRLTAYKIAFQSLIGSGQPSRFIQGWQVIGRYDKPERALGTDLLYLSGYRFNPRWSVFSISGVRLPAVNRSLSRPTALLNPSGYYNLTPTLTAGLEINSEVSRGRTDYLLLMPQVHFSIGKEYTIQLGIGAGRSAGESLKPTSGLRFVRQL